MKIQSFNAKCIKIINRELNKALIVKKKHTQKKEVKQTFNCEHKIKKKSK